ncbi:MAG TPA: hypothetical protein VK445_12415 [Dissulfurispiraceae bacterium]|nr:hypothetical protein [Dissulfurispiraceae bacterium]
MDFSQKLEDIFSAIAFAEEGEIQTARELMDRHEKALLVFTGQDVKAEALKYAITFCKRMNTELEILCPKKALLALESFKNRLDAEAVLYSVRVVDGCLKQAVVDLVDSNSDIRYVVIKSYDRLKLGCDSEKGTPWQDIHCPLVVVGS